MARIYDAQIEWQAPSAHRFQAQPLKDYITEGLGNIAKTSTRVSEGIQKINDRDAAQKMEKAGEAAQIFIDNFQDFSGDNYMEKMEAGAMKAWDEAFGSLDSFTQTRFMRNNPEARNIFNLKVKDAALNKTYDHENEYWTRQLPSIANGIVSLGDPNKIKKALEDEIYRLTDGTGMRQKDAQVAVDKLTAYVGQGAIAQAIGEGRVSDAVAMNNDEVLTAQLTPEQVARNNRAIKELINEKAKAAKETDPEKVLTDATVASFEKFYNQLYAWAGADEAKKEEVLRVYNKFLNDYIEDNFQDEYLGFPISMITPEGYAFKNTPRSVRQKIADKAVKQTIELDPNDKRIKTEIGYRATSKAASLDPDGKGFIDPEKVTLEDMGDVADILDYMQGYYGFDEGVQGSLNKLHQVYTTYIDRLELAIQPSAFENEDTVVTQRTGLGMRTNVFSQRGNITEATADSLRDGSYYKTNQGTLYNNDYKKEMDAGIARISAWTNKGKLPNSGTYREMIIQNTVAYAQMSPEDKRALGIEYTTNRQLAENLVRQANKYRNEGVLDSSVGETKTGARPTVRVANLDKLSPYERQDVYRSMANNKDFEEFITQFQKDHWNLHRDAISVLEATNGHIDKSFVGRKWINSGNDLEGVSSITSTTSVSPHYSASGQVAEISSAGNKITQKQIDKINKDWQEQVVKPINAALVEDYAFIKGYNKDSPVYKIVSNIDVPSATNAPRVPIGAPIRDTPYFSSFVDGIADLNKGAEPDEKTVAEYASANRATAYKNSATSDKVKRARLSNSANKADKETNEYKAIYGAAAYKVPIN